MKILVQNKNAMMDLFINNPNWFNEEVNYDALHTMTREWESDCKFWKDEIRFFQDLIDRHFLQMVSDKNLQQTQELVDLLAQIRDKDLIDLQSRIESHESHLDKLLNNDWPEEDYKKEHEQLARGIARFMGEFKMLKMKVFGLVEKIRTERDLIEE